MRVVTEHGMTKEMKKYPVKTKCTAGYERGEQETVFVDVGDGKKQTFVARPQSCVDENGI